MVMSDAAFAGVSAGWRIRDGGSGSWREEVFSLAIFNACVDEERTRLSVKAVKSHAAVFGVDVDANRVAAGADG